MKQTLLQEVSSNSTMDSKGRFQLPAVILRKIPAELEGRFVINRGTEKCLRLYPINNWEHYKTQLGKLNPHKTEMRRAIRYFMGTATELKLDGKNRLLIPQSLQEYAGLEKELLFIPMNEFVEVWNPKLWEEDLDSIRDTAEDTYADMIFEKEPENYFEEDGKYCYNIS